MENKEKDILVITTPEGDEEVEIVTELEDDNNNHFVVYTKDVEDESGNVEVYISKVIEKDGENTLEDVTEEEFNDIAAYLDSFDEED